MADNQSVIDVEALKAANARDQALLVISAITYLLAIGGNLFGGARLFALLAHAQVGDEMATERLPKPRRRAWAQTNSRKA
ncbi:MAG: hypothetical protein BVN32_03435 [Proteobacteria bacterium ST_bin14]|nr:MAG: hypothetical protein BVN32_03435 [Proteobacteria bacterium ST_bin14]